jgi:hypothetical protein
MANAKKKVAPALKEKFSNDTSIQIPKGDIFLIEDNVPMISARATGVETKFPREWAVIDGLSVSQNIAFTVDKRKMVEAIRVRMQKLTSKRFVLRQVDKQHCRMWRVEDHAKSNWGGPRKKKDFGNLTATAGVPEDRLGVKGGKVKLTADGKKRYGPYGINAKKKAIAEANRQARQIAEQQENGRELANP